MDGTGGDLGLARLSLRPGEKVRFRRPDRSRWQTGRVIGVERDGSIAVRDDRGASRSVPLDRLLVAAAGARGGGGWEPLLARASRTEQLELF